MLNPDEVVYKIANKAKNLSNKVSLEKIIKTADVGRKILPDAKKYCSILMFLKWE